MPADVGAKVYWWQWLGQHVTWQRHFEDWLRRRPVSSAVALGHSMDIQFPGWR